MTGARSPLRVAVIGFGAIGQALAQQLHGDGRFALVQIVVPLRSLLAAQTVSSNLMPSVRVLDALDLNPGQSPDLVIECAGHLAVQAHVVPALRSGIPCAIASIGALHDPVLLAQLEEAAHEGSTRLQLVSGAIGAIDALAAARLGGLDEVVYVGRKPPLSWVGTQAERAFDLGSLLTPQVIFRGSAREAAQQFPKNANVAATVSLAGLGLDRTQVELVADPGVVRNVHAIFARGAFGWLDMKMENLPLAANPKTSALTVYSLMRALHNAAVGIAI